MRYDKLVRDRIPRIIHDAGGEPVTHQATEEEYRRAIRAKLQEEVDEYLQSGEVGELIDIMEVVYALAELHAYSPERLDALRRVKAVERGAFRGHIILEQA